MKRILLVAIILLFVFSGCKNNVATQAEEASQNQAPEKAVSLTTQQDTLCTLSFCGGYLEVVSHFAKDKEMNDLAEDYKTLSDAFVNNALKHGFTMEEMKNCRINGQNAAIDDNNNKRELKIDYYRSMGQNICIDLINEDYKKE